MPKNVVETKVKGTKDDYHKFYPNYVDSTEPLEVLQQKDIDNWVRANEAHPVLSGIPNEDRVDHFGISYGTDLLQKLSIHHTKGDALRPVIFYIHGGGWNSHMFPNQFYNSRYATPTWVSLGYTVISPDYRLAPENPFPAAIDDCAMALKWVIDNVHMYGGDASRIAVVGESSGGHLTALLVTGREWHNKYDIDITKVKCWAPLCGVHNFNLKENYYHPWAYTFNSEFIPDHNMKHDASPVKHVSGKESPCLILHGSDDWLVPRTNSTDLHDKLIAKKVDSELVVLSGVWHCNTIVNYGEPDDKATELINAFFAKHIPTSENHL